MDRAVTMTDTLRTVAVRNPAPLKPGVWYHVGIGCPAGGTTMVWIDGELVAVGEPPGDDDPSRPSRAT